MMARRGTVKRVNHGVYRVEAIPPHPRDQYVAAVLWPRGGAEFPIRADVRAGLAPHQVVTAVLSHMTALELHDLSDVNPDKIHLTVPSPLRIRRSVPKLYVLHHASLTAEEITSVDGLPVTTIARTITDCAEAHLGPALLGQAIDQARVRGLLHAKDIADLERIVFGGQHDSHRSVT